MKIIDAILEVLSDGKQHTLGEVMAILKINPLQCSDILMFLEEFKIIVIERDLPELIPSPTLIYQTIKGIRLDSEFFKFLQQVKQIEAETSE